MKKILMNLVKYYRIFKLVTTSNKNYKRNLSDPPNLSLFKDEWSEKLKEINENKNDYKRSVDYYKAQEEWNIINGITGDLKKGLFETDTAYKEVKDIEEMMSLEDHHDRLNGEYRKRADDREFILEAVKQDGEALFYASEKLKVDREVVWRPSSGTDLRWNTPRKS